MALPPTHNNMTLTDHAMTLADHYHDPAFADGYNAQYWSGVDGYQRFVRLAGISPGESVLDFACGTGITGLLACEVLGGAAPNVYFADMSMPMLRKAKSYVARCIPTVLHTRLTLLQ